MPLSSGTNASHTRPMTSKPGGREPSTSTAWATCRRVVHMTRWSGGEARSMTTHGVSAGNRALAAVLASSPSDPSGCWGDSVVRSATRATMRWSAMRKTTVLEGTNSGGAGGLPFFPVPVQMSTWSATSRWVEGMLAKSGAESADVRPGSTVTRDAMPRDAKKPYSSPPRPYTNGFPCFSGSTALPPPTAARACDRSSYCAASALPGNFRAIITGVRRGIRSITPDGTSLSARMRSDERIALCVARVRRLGWQGPEPAGVSLPSGGCGGGGSFAAPVGECDGSAKEASW